MLTSGQCVIAAYLTDGDVICPDCAEKLTGLRYADLLDGMREEFEAEHGRAPRYSEEYDMRETVEETIRAAEKENGLTALIQYSLDSDETWVEEGLWCGDCGAVLVEPEPELEDEVEDEDEATDLTEIDFAAMEERDSQ